MYRYYREKIQAKHFWESSYEINRLQFAVGLYILYMYYSHHLSAWCWFEIVRRNSVLVTHGSWRVKNVSDTWLCLMCHFFVLILTTFWHHLWYITEKMHSNIKCLIYILYLMGLKYGTCVMHGRCIWKWLKWHAVAGKTAISKICIANVRI